VHEQTAHFAFKHKLISVWNDVCCLTHPMCASRYIMHGCIEQWLQDMYQQCDPFTSKAVYAYCQLRLGAYS
jgi:hypothetical protein